MSERTITLPVKATMRRQVDGKFEMVNAEYMTVDVAVVAGYIAERTGLTVDDENERHDLRRVVGR